MTIDDLRRGIQERIKTQEAYLLTQGNIYVLTEIQAELATLHGVVALIDGKTDPWGEED